MECTHASGCCGHSFETLSCPREKWCWKSKVSTSASAWGEGESGCCVQQKSLNWRISHDDLIVMRLHSEEARKPQPRREHFPADVRKRVHAPHPPSEQTSDGRGRDWCFYHWKHASRTSCAGPTVMRRLIPPALRSAEKFFIWLFW